MVRVRKGAGLRGKATYDTEHGSWFDSMGLNLVYMADGDFGHDPFKEQVQTTGKPTHGHLAAADNHGGKPTGLADPAKIPNGQTIDNGVAIGDFRYLPGDLSEGGSLGAAPVVNRGTPLHF